VKITMQHVRRVRGFSRRDGFCAKGVRRWFAMHDLDYPDFLKNGIDEEVLLATNDPMALATVEQAHGE
jgi:hypothetical protein